MIYVIQQVAPPALDENEESSLIKTNGNSKHGQKLEFESSEDEVIQRIFTEIFWNFLVIFKMFTYAFFASLPQNKNRTKSLIGATREIFTEMSRFFRESQQ